MKKRAIFIFILIFTLFFVIGYSIQNSIEQRSTNDNTIREKNENTIIKEETIEVNSKEEKTTPNTIMVLKKKYSTCGHVISSRASIPEEMVNLTKESVSEKYSEWEIEEFTTNQIVLMKAVDGFCNEHYLLIEEDESINLYILNEMGEKKLKKTIDIVIEYLPETDKITLKNGIMIYGKDNLNKILEDYEV